MLAFTTTDIILIILGAGLISLLILFLVYVKGFITSFNLYVEDAISRQESRILAEELGLTTSEPLPAGLMSITEEDRVSAQIRRDAIIRAGIKRREDISHG